MTDDANEESSDAGTTLRVLILEDRPADAELVEHALRKDGLEFSAMRVDTRDGFLKQLDEFSPNIVLADYSLPGFSGLAALALLRERDSDLPFIIVSGTIGEDVAADAMRGGANDYVMKDKLARLGPAVRRELKDAQGRRAQRQAEQREKELRAKLKRAKRLESLGMLAGQIAHDLNNILGPVVGYPDLILDRLPADTPLREDLYAIKDSANDAAAIIRDLLTLARRGKHQAEPVDLNATVRSYMKSPGYRELEVRFPDHSAIFELDDRPQPMLGSSAHLSEILMNLVVNAFEAMPDGGEVTVRTSLRTLAHPGDGYERIDEGSYVVLSVSDTGPGIAPEDLEHLFEPFFTRKQMGRSGSGLGLAIVYGIIKDHAGYVDIRTSPGEGTQFDLYFPVTDEALEPDEEEPEYLSGTETILVVDDMPSQRDLAVGVLSSIGYEVLSVASGRAAIDLLRQRRIDLVILDMIMESDFDGLDIYKQIIYRYPGQRCLIASGFSESERVKEAQKLGAGAFVQKPYTRDNIGQAVRRELDREGNSH